MKIELTAEQQQIVEQLVSSGRYASPDEAVQAGLVQLHESETENARIRGLVQEAVDAANRGEMIRGEDFLRERFESRLKRA